MLHNQSRLLSLRRMFVFRCVPKVYALHRSWSLRAAEVQTCVNPESVSLPRSCFMEPAASGCHGAVGTIGVPPLGEGYRSGKNEALYFCVGINGILRHPLQRFHF